MIERFRGKREVLIDSLKEQKLVRGNETLAEQIADVGELIEVEAGVAIIKQGRSDNDVYLILAGSFDIIVHGRRVARRVSGDHVGEMAATQPTQAGSATVAATELSVVTKIPNARFLELAALHPDVWRTIARELAKRLEQRNALVARTVFSEPRGILSNVSNNSLTTRILPLRSLLPTMSSRVEASPQQLRATT